jgi:two-component system copper resistance phosphate regulon response regulator CusR
MRFLIIEDDASLGAQVKRVLEELGYLVDFTSSGQDGEEKAESNSYDGVILDVMLPDHDGVQICRNLRAQKITTPILLLTALSTTTQKVAGFEAGADDYLTKPFALEELVARVRAMLRRAKPEADGILRYADIEMNLARHRVSRGGSRIVLTAKEFSLLELFMRNPLRVLARSLIGERIWDMFDHESNVIEVYVSRLRKKIDRGFEKPLIHTMIGSGYVLSTDGR